MSNDLITQAEKDQLPALLPTTAVDALLAADAISFLPYIQMLQVMSKLAQPGENQIAPGSFVLIENQTPVSLGNEVDVQLLSARALAWKFGPECNIRVYDAENPMFAEISEMSEFSKEEREAKGDANLYSWGVEYLVYLPESGKFATFHASSKSARISAQNDFHDLVASRSLITWYSEFFTSKKNNRSWFNLKTKGCNTGDQYDEMDISIATDVITKFQTPPEVDSVDTEAEGKTEAQ